eukprot:scaffold545_cov226-Pinguiococcus_pyrenoidosus.AAC.2
MQFVVLRGMMPDGRYASPASARRSVQPDFRCSLEDSKSRCVVYNDIQLKNHRMFPRLRRHRDNRTQSRCCSGVSESEAGTMLLRLLLGLLLLLRVEGQVEGWAAQDRFLGFRYFLDKAPPGSFLLRTVHLRLSTTWQAQVPLTHVSE